ncbi:MAG: hypothetical protein NTU83_00570, partial [Candidatus Hydrogenedentes bacterium]|nr:hypothetical protein [Candidatus Hydrogenedentota bacterium]
VAFGGLRLAGREIAKGTLGAVPGQPTTPEELNAWYPAVPDNENAALINSEFLPYVLGPQPCCYTPSIESRLSVVWGIVDVMSNFGTLDWAILIVYFCAIASIGPLFARRNRSTESFFVGNRQFPAWLLGLAMFATSISSITVVAYPADAYKTAYLRLLPCFMLPVGIFMASRIFLPFYRRSRCTSAFEYLEGRFGPGVRMYAACAFVLGQVMRISTILYLVSLVFQQITGSIHRRGRHPGHRVGAILPGFHSMVRRGPVLRHRDPRHRRRHRHGDLDRHGGPQVHARRP